ncbi:TPA: putative DNA binding domain-containing protein [Staphylococcus aureus]|uniref:RNA-binding domain-containing protein n=1 Tax=Staphylococcus aureus TaxID=1280 RepID=UPI0029590083|nr:RNA-binding domain-containing protein [Staphylococcus aureus]HEE8662944.1 putative DNA binding domain-containing protein [Staphylococcus aureus]HEE8665678.1 putative DNA binding domain-containing protein [Staphylococcus aureus]
MHRESKYIEYKKSRKGLSNDIWSTYSAFANTEGGTIYLGIEEKKIEDKKVFVSVGVEDPEKMIEDFWNALYGRSKVSQNILSNKDVKIVNIENKACIEIHVPEAPYSKKPIYVDNKKDLVYKRVDDADRIATEEEYKFMIVNSQDDIDTELLDNYDMSDLNHESIENYRKLLLKNTNDERYANMSQLDLMIDLGAYRKDRSSKDKQYKMTTACLLFFGKYNAISDRFPGFQLDYFKKTNYLDTDWKDRISSGDLGNEDLNVYSFFEKVLIKLTDNIEESLMHAYYDTKQSIKIVNCEDFIEFYNPGNMRINKEDFIHGGHSKDRNSILSTLFRRVGYSEKAGSGGPRIFDVVNRHKLKTPEIELTDMDTNVVLWKQDLMKEFEKYPELDKKVIKYIIDYGSISKGEALKMENMTEYQFRNILKKLKDDNLIKKEGEGPATKYVLIESKEADILRTKKVIKSLESFFRNK